MQKRQGALIHLTRAILMVLCGMLLFLILLCLINRPIRIWDEAIYANHAYEMAKAKNLWYFFDGQTFDHYNTKPPLANWLQAFCILVWGAREWALRLPTFLSLIGIGLLFVLFRRKMNLSKWFPWLAFFILLTTPGAVRSHVFLTADLDGLLLFFTTLLYIIPIYQVQNKRGGTTTWIVFFIAFLGAWFTKSTAVLLIMPSVFFIYWQAGWISHLIRSKQIWLGITIMIMVIAVYYFFREKSDPGSWQQVWHSEFTRYFSKVMSWHTQPFSFYIKNIFTRFNPFYSVVTLLLVPVYWLKTNKKWARLIKQCFIIIFIYLIIISIPEIKLEWYDAPIYPIWAMGLSMMCIELVEALWISYSNQFFNCSVLIMIASVFVAIPFIQICRNELLTAPDYLPEEKPGALLAFRAASGEIKPYKVFMNFGSGQEHHLDAFYFYQKTLPARNKSSLHLFSDLKQVMKGDTLLVVQQAYKDSLRARYKITQLIPNEDDWLVIK